ncbi:MAG: substrate-binding domain-containing protein [Clostridia bacterium]
MALRYQEIKKSMLENILTMQPHAKIASRNELCKLYLSTRTTVDKAVQGLLDEGYLYSRNGSGTYVADFTIRQTNIKRDVINIGVLLSHIMRNDFHGTLCGIEKEMSKRGINVIICNTDNVAEKQLSYLKYLINSGVRGLIIVPVRYANDVFDSESQMALSSSNIPVVFCNRKINGLDYPLVTANDYYGGYLATRHLIEMGYRNIAYIAPFQYETSLSRYQGYLAALRESQIEYRSDLVKITNSEKPVECGYELAFELLSDVLDVDGIFCFNDRTARGVVQALSDKELKVSEDIGIVGYDDSDPLYDLSAKGLTSVDRNKYDIGKRAAEILFSQIISPNRVADKYTIFNPILSVRDSCKGHIISFKDQKEG